MSREPVEIIWTKAQQKKLQPLFDEISKVAKELPFSWDGKGCDGLLGQVYSYGMQVRYVENAKVIAIQKINRARKVK